MGHICLTLHCYRCDYAIKQAECTLDKDVERIIKGFHSSGKPMGLAH